MKLVITCIVTLVIATGLALTSMEDPGYVVLAREPYVVRMPLLLLIMMLFVLFVLLYLLFNFMASLSRAPGRYRNWRQCRNEQAAHLHNMQGFSGLIEGNWSGAESALLKKLQYNKTPLLSYLGAAYAAQQQGQLERRNHYLDEVLERQPQEHLAINLTRARLLVQSGEVSDARLCLEGLMKKSPRSKPVLRLLAEVYRELGDWASLRALLPALKKRQVFPAAEIRHREHEIYERLVGTGEYLESASGHPAFIWRSLPAGSRANPSVIGSYVGTLVRSGNAKEAETVLRRALRKSYHPELIRHYGLVHSPFVEYQIELAESFLERHPQDPELLLALARLNKYHRQFEKARGYYEKSIGAGAGGDVYTDYAAMLETMGETELALDYYKRGLQEQGAHAVPDAAGPSAAAPVMLPERAGETVAQIMPVVR